MARILDFLGQLADELSATDDDEDGDGLLIHVVPTDDGANVGFLNLEGKAPADVLLGTVAPDEWVALGVAAHGWARPLDPATGGIASTVGGRGWRRRSSSVVLVHRSGQVVSRLRVGDEVHREPPAYGLTLDGLQRALGLPTAAPLVTTGVLFATMWLESVVVAAREGGTLTWAGARTLHPAIRLLASADEPLPPEAGDPIAAGTALARVCDWEFLRWQAVEGRWSAPPLTPVDAAWCDTGAFSRWVMTGHPGLDELLVEVKRAAGSGVSRRCASVLYRLGVLTRTAA